MEFQEVINKRRSIRDFRNTDVANDLITKIVAEAQKSASWANSQPWKVFAIKGEALKRVKIDHLKSSTNNDKRSSDLKSIQRSEWPKYSANNMTIFNKEISNAQISNEEFIRQNQNLFNAPVILLLCIPKNSPAWSILDLGAFSATLMLSAKNYGIDSIHAYEIVKYARPLRQVLNIPDEFDIITGIAIGYKSDSIINNFRSSRIPVKDVLTFIEK
ncbi:nitroreductase [Mycoplasmopsis adleri]|uniref:nitroreductase n=1 Tax=Mycoplasmopsis adleri TaxID=51362 RepID=UPI003873BFA1